MKKLSLCTLLMCAVFFPLQSSDHPLLDKNVIETSKFDTFVNSSDVTALSSTGQCLY